MLNLAKTIAIWGSVSILVACGGGDSSPPASTGPGNSNPDYIDTRNSLNGPWNVSIENHDVNGLVDSGGFFQEDMMFFNGKIIGGNRIGEYTVTDPELPADATFTATLGANSGENHQCVQRGFMTIKEIRSVLVYEVTGNVKREFGSSPLIEFPITDIIDAKSVETRLEVNDALTDCYEVKFTGDVRIAMTSGFHPSLPREWSEIYGAWIDTDFQSSVNQDINLFDQGVDIKMDGSFTATNSAGCVTNGRIDKNSWEVGMYSVVLTVGSCDVWEGTHTGTINPQDGKDLEMVVTDGERGLWHQFQRY